jgi:hypothetical protein
MYVCMYVRVCLSVCTHVSIVKLSINFCESKHSMHALSKMHAIHTGTLPLERKKEVYSIARKHGLVILEDDPYYYLQFSASRTPSYYSIDTDGTALFVWLPLPVC